MSEGIGHSEMKVHAAMLETDEVTVVPIVWSESMLTCVIVAPVQTSAENPGPYATDRGVLRVRDASAEAFGHQAAEQVGGKAAGQ